VRHATRRSLTAWQRSHDHGGQWRRHHSQQGCRGPPRTWPYCPTSWPTSIRTQSCRRGCARPSIRRIGRPIATARDHAPGAQCPAGSRACIYWADWGSGGQAQCGPEPEPSPGARGRASGARPHTSGRQPPSHLISRRRRFLAFRALRRGSHRWPNETHMPVAARSAVRRFAPWRAWSSPPASGPGNRILCPEHMPSATLDPPKAHPGTQPGRSHPLPSAPSGVVARRTPPATWSASLSGSGMSTILAVVDAGPL